MSNESVVTASSVSADVNPGSRRIDSKKFTTAACWILSTPFGANPVDPDVQQHTPDPPAARPHPDSRSSQTPRLCKPPPCPPAAPPLAEPRSISRIGACASPKINSKAFLRAAPDPAANTPRPTSESPAAPPPCRTIVPRTAPPASPDPPPPSRNRRASRFASWFSSPQASRTPSHSAATARGFQPSARFERSVNGCMRNRAATSRSTRSPPPRYSSAVGTGGSDNSADEDSAALLRAAWSRCPISRRIVVASNKILAVFQLGPASPSVAPLLHVEVHVELRRSRSSLRPASSPIPQDSPPSEEARSRTSPGTADARVHFAPRVNLPHQPDRTERRYSPKRT